MVLPNKSRVVMLRNRGVIDPSGKVSLETLQLMLDTTLMKLTGESNIKHAWSHFYKSTDVVGIKVNCLGGKMMRTHPELADCCAKGLKSINILERNIVIWDRELKELNDCGFKLNFGRSGVRCFGTDANGIGFEDDLAISKSIGSLLSKILTNYTTAQLNLPILKDHNVAGITVALKNYFGAINNPNKYHDDKCNPAVADLYEIPEIKVKSKLVVCDALQVQYNGGPGYKPYWIENYGGLIIGEDPVAVDYICYKIIENIRKAKGIKSLKDEKRYPLYIDTAADSSHRLGNNSMEKIELVEIGV